jgi:hypothetical protein
MRAGICVHVCGCVSVCVRARECVGVGVGVVVGFVGDVVVKGGGYASKCGCVGGWVWVWVCVCGVWVRGVLSGGGHERAGQKEGGVALPMSWRY